MFRSSPRRSSGEIRAEDKDVEVKPFAVLWNSTGKRGNRFSLYLRFDQGKEAESLWRRWATSSER